MDQNEFVNEDGDVIGGGMGDSRARASFREWARLMAEGPRPRAHGPALALPGRARTVASSAASAVFYLKEMRMANVLRIGLAGLGTAGTLVLPWFKRTPGAELAAVADPRPDALQAFEGTGVATFSSVEEMCVSDAVDVIWISTPNSTHMKYTILAVDNGKHVVCEKPMALSLQEAETMVQAVERNGVKYVQRSKNFDPRSRRCARSWRRATLGA